jgi:hypothetical protein
MTTNNFSLSAAGLAQMLVCSVAEVRRLSRVGVLPRLVPGRYDLKSCVAALT